MLELERINIFCGSKKQINLEYMLDNNNFEYFELNKNFKYMKDLYNVFMIYNLNQDDEELIMEELGETLKNSLHQLNKFKGEVFFRNF